MSLVVGSSARPRILTWLMVVFAVPVPVVIVLALLPQLQRIGEVSHWPWEEYGVLGWWLIPVSLALATGFGAARPGRARSREVWGLGAVAVLTTAALFFNP
ncbi:hypothetical protein [Georgenia sp. MJ170]|uniref:hypothetical protein n=1 Tax=Georgenia sunbinii TaxID=3117728 RepID=UPI002F267C9E